MSEGGLEIGIITFGEATDAERLVSSLEQRGAGHLIDEVGIIEHHADGKFSIHSYAPGATKGQHVAMGALVGGMFGLLLGPFGLVAGLLGGAGVGGLMQGRDPHQLELSDQFIQRLRDALPNGSSAVLVIGEPETVGQLMGQIRATGGVSKAELREPLTDEQVAIIRKALTDGN